MSGKFAYEYAQQVRELREAGHAFSASQGYLLASPNSWSAGQKAAVTRQHSRMEFADSLEADEPQVRDGDFLPDVGLSESDVEEFWDDAAGDGDEEWDDIDYFDIDEAEDLDDDEGDSYEETT